MQEIRRIYEEGKTSQHAIARRFGVSQHFIFKIVKGVSAALGEKE